MLIIDGHLDLAWNALQWNRDITLSADTLRVQEAGIPGKGRARNTVAFPEMRKGRVALSFATLLSRSTGNAIPHIDYASWQQAQAIGRGQMAYYRAVERDGHLRVITHRAGLDAHMAEWAQWEQDTTAAQPPLGMVISMESADPIRDPEELAEWHALGVRLIGPAHYGMGRYAGGTSVEDGLTDLGLRLLDEMMRLEIILDMTHLSDRSFWQALDRYAGVVIASHNNCRALVPHQRQFDDDQLRAIIGRGGVIGAAFDTWMLEPGWIKEVSTNANVTLATVVDHIDHVCQLAGNADHAAIGSDLDGGYGTEQTPRDLETIADLHKIAAILRRRGYAEDDVAKVMHGNWVRFFRDAWKK